jgi:intracellular sulfur oxidation DsrE/DsrF family protein
MKTQNNQAVITLLESNIENVDFAAFLFDAEFTTFEEIRDILEDNAAFNIDVIYYSEAVKFLMRHDNSLRQSLDIASDLGYEIKDINSELLASLLASEIARNDFYELKNKINNVLIDIEQEVSY